MAHGYPDYEGDKSGLYLRPEWAAVEGTDKTIRYAGANIAISGGGGTNYVVPAGKKLYITNASFYIYAAAEADRDNNQIGTLLLYNVTTATTYAPLGGNGGGSITLPKPPVFLAGETFQLLLHNESNHVVNIEAVAHGYEV